ncbi:MAG: GNAT family N-acetyltransferase [Candidatus Thorarchaeota archaeon]|nr:MAG: GNAT family N-acetyltransferase [Candidatus Thorarchaeota archaeon]
MTQSKIRPIHLDDLDGVIEIEQASFPNPWDDSIFFQIAVSGGRYQIDDDSVVIMYVMGKNGSVNGYIVWEELKEDKHGHILNLAVHSDFRKQGRGQRLLSHSFSSMKRSGMETCELEVRESNHWARHLYENSGMIAVDRSVGYYESEDAIIYTITFAKSLSR